MPQSKSNGVTIEYNEKKSESEVLTTKIAKVKEKKKYSGFGDNNDLFNSLYLGDNLPTLQYLLTHKDLGKVTLVYIDPPFAANHAFESRGGGRLSPMYRDNYGDIEYLEFLRKRLILLREILSDDGSIYVHIGEDMFAQVKLLLDEIFGRKNFQNIISRRKCHSKNATKKKYGNIQDFILYYTKSNKKIWHQPTRAITKEERERFLKEYRHIDERTGRRYMKVPIVAQGERNGATGGLWRGEKPLKGKHWSTTPEKLDKLDRQGLIVWSKNGNPRKKVFFDENKEVPISDIWMDTRDYYNQMQSITGYPTEKNEELLKRIIRASSNEGDTILDAFVGSGTTLAAAEKTNRQWIGIDNNPEAIDISIQRLLKIQSQRSFMLYEAQ